MLCCNPDNKGPAGSGRLCFCHLPLLAVSLPELQPLPQLMGSHAIGDVGRQSLKPLCLIHGHVPRVQDRGW